MKKLVKRLKNQKGLTLVELLAVIVILGIVAAIAIPSIGNIIAKSNFNAAKADALQILAAAQLADSAGEKVSGDDGVANVKNYLDITDKNIEDGWSIKKDIDTNKLSLVDAESKHKAKGGESVTFAGTRDEISKMTFENMGKDGDPS